MPLKNMKNYICSLLFILGSTCCELSIAQTDYNLRLQFSSRSTIQARADQFTFYNVRNIGTEPSPEFSVRVWVSSTEGEFPDELSVLNEFEGLDPFDPTQGRPSVSPWVNFSMPLPEDRDNGAQLSSILGDQYFFQACLYVEGVLQECTLSRTRDVVPPAVNNVEIVDDTNGRLVLNWQEVPWDIYTNANGQEERVNFVSWYVIRQFDPAGILDDNVATLTPDEIDVAEGDVGSRVYRRIFTEADGLELGKRYSYSVHSCHTLTLLGCHDQRPSRPGNGISSRVAVAAIEAEFQASLATFDDGIEVSWEAPTTNPASTRRYEITRCEEGDPDSCLEPFEPEGNATTYFDSDVIRGRRYVYTIDACDRVITTVTDPRLGKCFLGRIHKYKIGVTNSGSRGLVDEFEEDDTAAQATEVSRNVLQLHSFDSSTDEDWVKLTLNRPTRVVIETRAFEGANVDTELTLYNSNLELIDQNVDRDRENFPGSFSKIESERLAPGDYFIRSTHFKLIPAGETEPIFPAPLADNYFLAIELIDLDTILNPILLLLLDEE